MRDSIILCWITARYYQHIGNKITMKTLVFMAIGDYLTQSKTKPAATAAAAAP